MIWLARSTCTSRGRPAALTDLPLDERDDADPGEHVLPRETLHRHAVAERLASVGHHLAQVTREQRHVRLEDALRLGAQVAY